MDNSVHYYAMQVKTREEKKFLKIFSSLNPDKEFSLHFPQRVLDIRRKGKLLRLEAPVFPGYVFLELDREDNVSHYLWDFCHIKEFFRFLPSNKKIIPLSGRCLEIILHFIKKIGPVAGKSKVTFDENSRIIVIDGPLLGLEGNIIKVDKRKKRAKIKLDLYDDSFLIDLAFEYLDAPKP